nr:hypothetical protein [Nanoarchaeum sp.]
MTNPIIKTIEDALKNTDLNVQDFIQLASIVDNNEQISRSVPSPFIYPTRSPLYEEYKSSSNGLARAYLTDKGIECWVVLKKLAESNTSPELIRQVYSTYSSLKQKHF